MNKALFTLFVMWACAQAFAADKPQVAVHFNVKAAAYKGHFGGRLSGVENQGTGLLIRALRQHIQFVDFIDSSGTGAQYVLTVSLSVDDDSVPVAGQPVWLKASLTGQNLSSSTKLRKFREAATGCTGLTDDSDCRWPDESEFLGELKTLLAASSMYSSLVSTLFHDVSIANSGKFVVQPISGWVLPFRQEDVCLGMDTKLRIVNDIPTQQITLHGKFRADVEGPYGNPPDSIFSTLVDGEDGADNNKRALLQQFPDKVVVRGVYLLQYQHLDENCGRAIPPPTAPSATGGGQ